MSKPQAPWPGDLSVSWKRMNRRVSVEPICRDTFHGQCLLERNHSPKTTSSVRSLETSQSLSFRERTHVPSPNPQSTSCVWWHVVKGVIGKPYRVRGQKPLLIFFPGATRTLFNSGEADWTLQLQLDPTEHELPRTLVHTASCILGSRDARQLGYLAPYPRSKEVCPSD